MRIGDAYSCPELPLTPPDYGEEPKCPICGEVCETLYEQLQNTEILGCESCITEIGFDDPLIVEEHGEICPECEEASDVFYARGKEVVGCEVCVQKIEAWRYQSWQKRK